ncbi:MAG: DUF2442 domain-containing protein [Ignavibacteriales bacterium]|nr:MAG: DUF2442 domain-containing protein [Ignavibacteriales bacterium]
MNTLANNHLAKRIDFNEDNLIVVLSDGRTLSVPLPFFPRLLNGTDEQRKNYIISGGGLGIHWEELEEDIDVNNLLYGFGDTTNKQNPESLTAA